MPRRFVPLVLLAALSGLVAACSSSTPYVPPSTTPGTSSIFSSLPSPSAVSGTATAPATRAQLATTVLTAKDMSGWKATALKDNVAADKAQSAFTTCIGVPDSPRHRVADVHSPEFKLQGTQVSTESASFTSRADVDRTAAALLSSKAAGCFKALIQAQAKAGLPKGSQLGAVTAQLSKPTGADPVNVLARATATLPVDVSGQTVAVYTDVVYLRTPFIQAQVQLVNVGAAVDKELEKSLVSTVSDRLAKVG